MSTQTRSSKKVRSKSRRKVRSKSRRKVRSKSKTRRSKSKRITYKECKKNKMYKTMHDFKYGNLKLQNGSPVTNRKHAIAIGLTNAEQKCKHLL